MVKHDYHSSWTNLVILKIVTKETGFDTEIIYMEFDDGLHRQLDADEIPDCVERYVHDNPFLEIWELVGC